MIGKGLSSWEGRGSGRGGEAEWFGGEGRLSGWEGKEG